MESLDSSFQGIGFQLCLAKRQQANSNPDRQTKVTKAGENLRWRSIKNHIVSGAEVAALTHSHVAAQSLASEYVMAGT
jgi:hypothetical protein